MNPTLQKIWGAIENVLRRHPWAVTLLAMIPCAFFSAAMVNDVVAANVLKADIAALSRPGGGMVSDSSSRPAAESMRSRDTDQMLRRNVFDADAGCLNCPPPPPPVVDSGVEGDDSAPPQPCEGSVKIMGAVESDDPTWSFVFAMPTAGQPTMPFRLGQSLDTKTIASIGWAVDYGAYVILRQPGGPRCFYAQVMPPRPPPTQVATAAVAQPTAGAEPGDALSQILEQGIVRESGNQFTLRRNTVDRILENQGELMRTTRVMPHMEGGRIAGLTMFGVRAGTLLGRIGLQNGDVLTRINGLEIASPDKALEAYSRLRTADHLTVSVLRNGAPVNIDFNIRP